MLNLPKQKKGFTLVELMIVITVIAILATIAVVSFTRVQKQARDTKRKADLRSIATAMQAYFSETNSYPATANVATALVPTYIPVMPVDPSGDTLGSYSYVVSGSTFGLCSQLEAVAGTSSYWNVTTQNSGGILATSCVGAQ